MSDVDVVAEAIYREQWAGEPRYKQDRFHTLHPDDQDEYRRMARAAIEATRAADIQRALNQAYFVGSFIPAGPVNTDPGGFGTQRRKDVRRYVEWCIYGVDRDQWGAVRYENGKQIGLGLHDGMQAATTAVEYDRATVLADPMATESRSMEVRAFP